MPLDQARVEALREWLIAGAPGSADAAAVFQRICDDLVGTGIPVERAAAYVRTLHPHIMGRGFFWEPGVPVKVTEASHAMLNSPGFLGSPANHVCKTRQSIRRRLIEPDCPRDFRILDELAATGITDYFIAPMAFMSGQLHAVTFATRHADGFEDAAVVAIERILVPLARVAEILALSRTAVNLLNTYVGRNAGERIIAGNIQRGDVDTIRAVIWFSDLRGFTELAGSVAPQTLIGILNDVFECQVPAIEKRGGEVLKFMGDGMLAIFPIDAQAPGAIVDHAIAAAVDAFDSLAKLNEGRSGRGESPMRFGLALHVGDVAYGNIGGAGRLDFTCIGPAVNLAARLETLTGKLGRPIVASAACAEASAREWVDIGSFDLKGVSEPQRVFGLPDGEPLSRW